MSSAWLTARGVGAFVFWRAAVLGALAGALDVASHGADLRSIERIQAVALWTAFACLPSLPLAGIAMILARVQPRPFARAGVWVTILGILSAFALLGAVQRDYATAGGALLVGAAAFFWTRAGRRVDEAADSLGAVAAFCVVALVSALTAVLGGWIAFVLPWLFAGWTRWRPLTWPHPRLRRRSRWLVHGALLLAVLLSFAGLPAASSTGSAVREGPPDVVMIVLDTLRADHLGAYGSTLHTPAFDRLAEEGTQYQAAFANAPWTVPSHASLFTGLPSRSHGCSFDQHRWLDEDFTTLAEAFAARGYQTAGFSSNIYLQVANLDQGFEVFEEPGRRRQGLALRRFVQLVGWPSRWSDHGAQDALARVRRYLAHERDPARPQFLFVNLLEPHWRHMPAFADRLAHLPDGVDFVEATRISSRYYGPLAMAGQVPAGVVPVLRGLYAAAVEYQDRQLATLREIVEASLDLDRAVLVVTADHGENLGEAGRFDHVFAVNDHLVHVPLVLRAPGRVAAGARVDDLCQLSDVPATLAALVPGLEELGGGASLLEGQRLARDFVVVEGDPYYGHLDRMAQVAGPQRGVREFVGSLVGIRDRDHKLVLSTHAPPALYVPGQDPDECLDVADREALVVQRLQEHLEAWRAEHPEYHGERTAEGGLTEEQIQRLSEIGY